MMIRFKKVPISICLLVASSIQAAGNSGQNQSNLSEPHLKYFSVRSYPQLALTLMLQGDVQAKVSIKSDGNIAKIDKVSGDELLFKYSSESIQDWRFETSEYPSQLLVTFRFQILSGEGAAYPVTRISGNLPTLVEITTPIHRQDLGSNL